LDYLNDDSDAYTETRLPGANLHVNDVSATSFSSFLDMKLSLLDRNLSDSTSNVPTLKHTWQQEFNDSVWTVDANFAGVPASAFKVTGAELSKDSLVAGGTIAMRFSGNVDAVIDYEGRFGSGRQNNTVIGRQNFRL
jgi:uncharacterized protein with beta-barrel porin domain